MEVGGGERRNGMVERICGQPKSLRGGEARGKRKIKLHHCKPETAINMNKGGEKRKS